jgi:hypothetical protein
MPGTLFAFDKSEKVILNPDAIKLAPGLKKLKSAELLFVVLAYDYESPYHQFDEGERILKAKRTAFGSADEDISKNKVLEKGIEEYKSLQFNVERENQLSYQAKIAQLRLQLYDSFEAKKIKEITQTIEYLNDEINKIQEKLDLDATTSFTSAGESITFIERWQLNQKKYKAKMEQQRLFEEDQKRKYETAKAILSD